MFIRGSSLLMSETAEAAQPLTFSSGHVERQSEAAGPGQGVSPTGWGDSS